MNLVWRCTHMFHPPPHPLPPEDKQRKGPFFSSETLNLKNFHLFAFIIKHCRATGCLFSSSPPPTYSMGSCTYPACSGYTNYHWQPRLANTDWGQKKKGPAFVVKSWLLAVMRIRQSNVTSVIHQSENCWFASSALCQSCKHLCNQVHAAASYTCIKTHLSLSNLIWCDKFLHMVLFLLIITVSCFTCWLSFWINLYCKTSITATTAAAGEIRYNAAILWLLCAVHPLWLLQRNDQCAYVHYLMYL